MRQRNWRQRSLARRIMPGSAMHAGMAFDAQCDQVLFCIIARTAPRLLVVYFQLAHAAASLATPLVTLEDMAVQFAIAIRGQFPAWLLAANPDHVFFPA